MVKNLIINFQTGVIWAFVGMVVGFFGALLGVYAVFENDGIELSLVSRNYKTEPDYRKPYSHYSKKHGEKKEPIGFKNK